MTIRAEGSVTTTLDVERAKALVHANLAAAGLTVDAGGDHGVTGSGGKLLKYRLLGIWLTPTDQLPITVDVEIADSPDGTVVSATVEDRQGPGIPLNLDPGKYAEAGQAAIAAAFAGLTA